MSSTPSATSTSLPSIGAHCAVSSCNINDFLPIRCRCDRLFCKDHIFPDTHECLLLNRFTPSSSAAVSPALKRCALEQCTKPSLEAFFPDSENATASRSPAVCPQCHLSFCAAHRHPNTHSCPFEGQAISQPTKNKAAHALLAKLFPPTSDTATKTSQSPSKPTLNPKKIAQLRQVEAMKMRHRALPGDPKDKASSVSVTDRVHVKVHLDHKDMQEKILWFHKTIGTGKALDLCASHLGIASSDSSPLSLVKAGPGDDTIVLRNDQLLSEQVEDGSQLIVKTRIS